MTGGVDSAPGAPFDVLAMGRVGVDVYPLQAGSLEDVTTFQKFVGGSATNVSIAARRLGLRAAIITRVGEDPFGRYVRRTIRELGVDDRFVRAVPGLPTPVTFCELFPPDDFPIYFYRFPKAPDLVIEPDELDAAAITGARLFWCTVTGLSAEPSRSAHAAALTMRARRGPTVLDLDYRPSFWESPAAARAAIAEVIGRVTVVVGNREECAVATGEDDPTRAAEALLATGAELVVVKGGPAGVTAFRAGERVAVPPISVEVVNGIGAGDAFGGALCLGLLEGWELERTLGFANAAGAIVASRLECSTAMPTPDEVAALLAETSLG
ncbi:MAG: 5-dehydro-2-deoxygluconokinase [Actinomycetota bacterium]|nr:5-dehydro-2-deoxygluconokinase [Actinomycetota bacterium]